MHVYVVGRILLFARFASSVQRLDAPAPPGDSFDALLDVAARVILMGCA